MARFVTKKLVDGAITLHRATEDGQHEAAREATLLKRQPSGWLYVQKGLPQKEFETVGEWQRWMASNGHELSDA